MNELTAQFDQQNIELEHVWATLGSLGDNGDVAIPQAVLDEIDDPSSFVVAQSLTAIRGGIRA